MIIALDLPGTEEDDNGSESVPADVPVVTVRWSAREVLRHRDFATFTDAEFVEARRLMTDLRLMGATRPSRRRKESRRNRGAPDLRRTVRRSMRAGGEPMSRAFLEPGERT